MPCEKLEDELDQMDETDTRLWSKREPESMVIRIMNQERMEKAMEMRKSDVNGTVGRNMLRLRVGLHFGLCRNGGLRYQE